MDPALGQERGREGRGGRGREKGVSGYVQCILYFTGYKLQFLMLKFYWQNMRCDLYAPNSSSWLMK